MNQAYPTVFTVFSGKCRELVSDSRGAALAITLAFVMPIYLLVIGIYGIGEVVRSKIELQNAADAAAWLEMPGLELSLPVVQAQDNQTYLHTAFDGSDSPEGCLFFAAPVDGETELYRVIYGHNLHTGSMFSGLLRYREQDFYTQYPTFTLYTPEETQTWRIFSCHEATDTGEIYRTGRTEGEEYDAFLQQLLAGSDYDTGAAPPSGAQVLTLSTCATSYGSGLERYVVHAYRES